MRTHTYLDEDGRKQVVESRKQFKSYARISKETGASMTTIWRIAKDAGLVNRGIDTRCPERSEAILNEEGN